MAPLTAAGLQRGAGCPVRRQEADGRLERRRLVPGRRVHRSGSGSAARERPAVSPSRRPRDIGDQRGKSGGVVPTAEPQAAPPHGRGDTARAEGPGGHEVDGEEPEREQPHVVEAALRVDRGGHARGDAEQGDADAEAAPHQHGGDGPQAGQHQGPGVGLAEVEGPPLDVRVAHGDGVGVLQPERSEPEAGEQDADEHGRGGPPQRAPPLETARSSAPLPPIRRMPSSRMPQRAGQQLDHRDDGGAAERVHAPDDVGEDAQGQDDRGPAPVPTLAYRSRRRVRRRGRPGTG